MKGRKTGIGIQKKRKICQSGLRLVILNSGFWILDSAFTQKEIIMFEGQLQSTGSANERRRYPRYPVVERLNLAVEDESVGESIGIGEATDISLGGLRVRYLPKNTAVQAGDKLGLLLIDEEQALSLHAEVVHHGTSDSFGVEFRDLLPSEQREIDHLLQRLHL
jgi:c-di-GMP-binding flagellar brake protein YcgR